MHDGAAQAGVGLGAEVAERPEPQNIPGEDVVGVGQHALDAADAEPARPGFDRRAGGRHAGGFEA